MRQSQKHVIAVLLLFVALCARICLAFEFCGEDLGKSLCEPQGSNHFICDADVQVPISANFSGTYPMTEKARFLILDIHNALRDHLASGQAQDNQKRYFPPARRMRTLIWDTELEYIAHVHATRCNMVHSVCHNTKRHPFAGQNLAQSLSGAPLSGLADLNRSVNEWFNEKNSEGLDATTIYKEFIFSETYGHFEGMIQEQVSRIGCAIAKCTDCVVDSPPSFKYGNYMTCQMDSTNIDTTPNYYKGAVASECDHWNTVPSTKYPNLCENTGEEFEISVDSYEESELDKY